MELFHFTLFVYIVWNSCVASGFAATCSPPVQQVAVIGIGLLFADELIEPMLENRRAVAEKRIPDCSERRTRWFFITCSWRTGAAPQLAFGSWPIRRNWAFTMEGRLKRWEWLAILLLLQSQSHCLSSFCKVFFSCFQKWSSEKHHSADLHHHALFTKCSQLPNQTKDLSKNWWWFLSTGVITKLKHLLACYCGQKQQWWI